MGQARSFLTLGGSFFGDQRVGLRVGLCGIGPALAGNVGTGGAFARLREGDQGVDVPMLAPDLSRCRPGVLSGGGGSILGRDEGGVLRREMMDCVVGGALRDRSCARRERWDRGSFRAFARGGSGCRRSYARSGPIPLPPRGVVWGRWVDFEKEFKKGDDGLRCR